MKVLQKRDKKDIPLADAVARSLDRSGYGDGELERLRDKVERQGKAIGALVAACFAGRVLNVEELSEFLDWDYEVQP